MVVENTSIDALTVNEKGFLNPLDRGIEIPAVETENSEPLDSQNKLNRLGATFVAGLVGFVVGVTAYGGQNACLAWDAYYVAVPVIGSCSVGASWVSKQHGNLDRNAVAFAVGAGIGNSVGQYLL